MHVLIVEDEAISRRALTLLLTASGYHPTAYASAEEALAHLNGGAVPQVVLVDVDLPGISGLELVDRLTAQNAKLRAVLLTAADGERIQRFRQDHAVEYLRKPINFDRLLQLLNGIVGD